MNRLKCAVFLFFMTGLISSRATAQMVQVGLRSGVNIATLADSKQEVDSPRLGFLAGIYGSIGISGTGFSLQPELLYSQKGAEINDVETRIDYLEIPVLVRFDISVSGALSPHIYGGPYVGFKLNAETDPASDPPLDEDAKDNDWGLLVGAGVDVNKFSIGLRYGLGLEEILESEEERNQVFSIVVGVGF